MIAAARAWFAALTRREQWLVGSAGGLTAFVVHAAHERRPEDAHAPRGHGREAVRHCHVGQPDHRPTPCASPLQRLPPISIC
ncbi:MAG: hypothetical protein RLZZ604_92 [Pseudomonadota bacterium]